MYNYFVSSSSSRTVSPSPAEALLSRDDETALLSMPDIHWPACSDAIEVVKSRARRESAYLPVGHTFEPAGGFPISRSITSRCLAAIGVPTRTSTARHTRLASFASVRSPVFTLVSPELPASRSLALEIPPPPPPPAFSKDKEHRCGATCYVCVAVRSAGLAPSPTSTIASYASSSSAYASTPGTPFSPAATPLAPHERARRGTASAPTSPLVGRRRAATLLSAATAPVLPALPCAHLRWRCRGGGLCNGCEATFDVYLYRCMGCHKVACQACRNTLDHRF